MQVLLGHGLTERTDVACGYHWLRPLLLSLGVADALGSAMGRAGGYSDGRAIGVVFKHQRERAIHAADAWRRGCVRHADAGFNSSSR